MYRKLDKRYNPRVIAEAMEEDSENSGDIVKELTTCMSNAFVLYQRARAYHWNYTGPSFAELHKVFGDIYDRLTAEVDELAERIRALDSVPPSSLSDMTKNSDVDDDESNLKESDKMVSQLSSGMTQYKESLKSALKVANSSEDDASIDMLGAMLKETEKTVWMLDSSK